MLTETQLIVGSSVLVGMLFGAVMMQLAIESKYSSFWEIIQSAQATAIGLAWFVLFTGLWAGYVASGPAVVFEYWALPIAWAVLVVGIARYGLASDIVARRAVALADLNTVRADGGVDIPVEAEAGDEDTSEEVDVVSEDEPDEK